jgi:hypothetical protein
MEVDVDTTALDGNVAAGILANVFYPEVTIAATSCAHCGAVRQLGELDAYVHSPGIILRCTSCEAVLLRVMQNRNRVWLDMSGISVLQLELPQG